MPTVRRSLPFPVLGSVRRAPLWRTFSFRESFICAIPKPRPRRAARLWETLSRASGPMPLRPSISARGAPRPSSTSTTHALHATAALRDARALDRDRATARRGAARASRRGGQLVAARFLLRQPSTRAAAPAAATLAVAANNSQHSCRGGAFTDAIRSFCASPHVPTHLAHREVQPPVRVLYARGGRGTHAEWEAADDRGGDAPRARLCGRGRDEDPPHRWRADRAPRPARSHRRARRAAATRAGADRDDVQRHRAAAHAAVARERRPRPPQPLAGLARAGKVCAPHAARRPAQGAQGRRSRPRARHDATQAQLRAHGRHQRRRVRCAPHAAARRRCRAPPLPRPAASTRRR